MSLTGYTINKSTFDGIAGKQTSTTILNSDGENVYETYFPCAVLQARLWVLWQLLHFRRG